MLLSDCCCLSTTASQTKVEYDYKVIFHNLAGEKDHGAIELGHKGAKSRKAGEYEWIWIDTKHHIAHLTKTGSTFKLRDKTNKERFTVKLYDGPKNEL